MNLSEMNGYEFENYIAALFRKMGFIVEETSLSGDGGIDLIAYNEKPIFKGKYIVQCKLWESNVGEPPVRDLYGVVLSNNAAKGILITNSGFTRKAIEFVENKNIELIDGKILNKLLEENGFNKPNNNPNQFKHFTEFEEFETTKYEYYSKKLNSDKRNSDNYERQLEFLNKYIRDSYIEIMFSGLIEESIRITDEIIKRFFKSKKDSGKRGKYIGYKEALHLLLGEYAKSYEIIFDNRRLDFMDFKSYGTSYIFYCCFHFTPIHIDKNYDDSYTNYFINETSDISGSPIINKVNVLKVLRFFNDTSNYKYLYNRFKKYYETTRSNILESKCATDIVRRVNVRDVNIEDLESSYSRILTELEFVDKDIDKRIFVPLLEKTGGIKYNNGIFIDLDKLLAYWDSDNHGKQREKISFINQMNDEESKS